MPTFSREISSTPDARSFIKEIQSSLSRATSITEDGVHEVPDDYSSMIDRHCCKSTVRFECGRLKWSRVKREWSVVHRPTRTCEDNIKKSSACKKPVRRVIARLWPSSVPKQYVVHNRQKTKEITQKTHNMKLSTATERRQTSPKRRKLSNNEEKIDDVDHHFDSIDNGELDCNVVRSADTGLMLPSATPRAYSEGEPISPPIKLVRCLLNGAEFISIMNCARLEIEASEQEQKDDIDNINSKKLKKTVRKRYGEKAGLRSKARICPRSIDLLPMINALAAATMGKKTPSAKPSALSSSSIIITESNDGNIDKSSFEKNVLNFIDECIQFAHTYTLELVAPWLSCWQMRTSLADTTSFTTCSVMNTLDQNGSKHRDQNYSSNATFISMDAITKIQEFVRACLAQSQDDILQLNAVTMGFTTNTSTDSEIRRGYSNPNYDCVLSQAPNQSNTTCRKKVFSQEPADSLVAACMKGSKTTLSVAKKSLSACVRKHTLMDKQRQRRGKYSSHISTLPSVLENTATLIVQGKGRSTQTIRSNSSSRKRKYPDSLSPQIKRDKGRALGKNETFQENFNHDGWYYNMSEVESKDRMSPNSLYKFFDKKRNRITIKVPRDISCMDVGDRKQNHALSPQQQETKKWNPTHSLKMSQLEQSLQNSVCCKMRMDKNDSLHRLSKQLRPIPATSQSLGVVSPGSESYSESMNTNEDNFLNADYIKRQASVNKARIPEQEAKSGKTHSLSKFSQIEECLGPHRGLVKVDEKKLDISSTNEAMSQSTMCKNNLDRKGRSDNLLIKRSQECSITPDDARTDYNLNQQPNPKGNDISREAASGLPWVRLSHIGHISDYHGYKRKYEHFVPLQFGPIDDIQRQIKRTLFESKHGNNEESDTEVIQDNQDYEQAIERYKVLAEMERSLKMKRKVKGDFVVTQKPQKEILGEMLVMFSTPELDDILESSVTSSSTTMCKMKTLNMDELSSWKPQINFRFHDEDDILLDTDEGKREKENKRKSRSAKIALQKKTSIRILSEMLHTLDFIEKYNCQPEGLMQEVAGEVEKRDANVVRKDEDSTSKKANGKQCNGDLQGRGRVSLANNKLPITLTPASLLQSYKSLLKQFSSFRPLDGKGEIKITTQYIQSILGNESLLDKFLRDDEIISEEKNLARCIRGYSSKADQEKIEKRNFEEQQKLREHEYEYYSRLRKKKKSLHEIEWKEMSSRPIYFTTEGSPDPTWTNICNFKQNCTICNPMLDEVSCNTIFSPRFRHREKNTFIPSGSEPHDNSIGNIDFNFIAPIERQKLSSLLQLLELYHTLKFIEDYNNGMIVSRKKRK